MAQGQDFRRDQRGHGYGGQPAYGGQPSYGGQPAYGGTPVHDGQPGWGPLRPDGAPGMAAGQPPRRPGRKRHTGRNVLAGLAGLGAVIVVITVAASGGGHAVSTTGSGTGSSAAASGPASGKPGPARTGSTITLSGIDSGEQLAVTVVRVISSGAPGDEFTSPPAGERLFAVQFRLRDTGSGAYSDSPSNGAAIVDSAGQAYQASMTDTVTGCQEFPAVENIAPGSSGLGCIVFEAPSAAKITAVQFTLDSGMGPQTGQWTVSG